jgi:hypothetical protein
LDEPQQLTDDRSGVELLGGEKWKALPQVKAHLVAETAQRAGAGPIALLDTAR